MLIKTWFTCCVFVFFFIRYSSCQQWYSTGDLLVQHLLKYPMIFNGLERSLSSGNWDVQRFRMSRKGVSQVITPNKLGLPGILNKPQFGILMLV